MMPEKKPAQNSGKSKGIAPWILLLVLLSVAAYFLKPFVFGSKQESVNKKWDKKDKDVAAVAVVAVSTGDMPVYMNGLGTVTALRTVTVKSRVDGEIVRVAFKEGAIVHQGDLLIEIDPRPYQIQIMQAEGQLMHDQALLKNAKVDVERYKTLLKQDSIASQQVVTQESLVMQYQGTVETDKALLDNAKLQLSFTKITSPITGRLGLRLVDQGNMIHASDASGLVVITQIQPIAVMFTLPEDQLPAVMKQLRSGNTMSVDAFDRSGKTKIAEGQLLAVDNQIDLNTGTVKLKAKFANENLSLFANQFVNIKMLIDTLQSISIIPSAAVQTGENGSYVYVVKADQTVTVRSVKLGPVDGENVAVLDCLDPDEVVVVDGADMLRENMKVKLIAHGSALPVIQIKEGKSRGANCDIGQ